VIAALAFFRRSTSRGTTVPLAVLACALEAQHAWMADGMDGMRTVLLVVAARQVARVCVRRQLLSLATSVGGSSVQAEVGAGLCAIMIAHLFIWRVHATCLPQASNEKHSRHEPAAQGRYQNRTVLLPDWWRRRRRRRHEQTCDAVDERHIASDNSLRTLSAHDRGKQGVGRGMCALARFPPLLTSI
jgi:hypothetical protein